MKPSVTVKGSSDWSVAFFESLLGRLDEFERVEKELTELKSRVLSAMNGNKRGLIYGEHRISLRARGAGLPYLHHEKGK